MKHANLFLVRHGETLWNAERRIQGSLESHLSEKGKQQMHAMGKQLSSVPMHALYSSPLIRAKQSAEIFQLYHDLEMTIDHDLRERSFGAGEGLTIEEFNHRFEKELAHMYSLPIEARHKHRVAQGSETVHELKVRVTGCLQRIARRHAGENVLIATHGWVVKILFLMLEGRDERTFIITNGTYVHVEGSENSLKIIQYQGLLHK